LQHNPIKQYTLNIHQTFAALARRCLIRCFLCLLPLICCTVSYAQDDEKEDKGSKYVNLHHTLELGYSLGGQISNDNFIYKAGLLGQYTADFQVSSRVYYGAGMGYEKLDHEIFIPIFASFKGLLKKKDSTPFLTAQLGYALGSNKNLYSYQGYSYRGGILFSPGWGYKLSVKDKYAILFSVNYKHQFAKIRYKTLDNHRYEDNLNFDMLSFRIGVML
jgi:hypothetical protein